MNRKAIRRWRGGFGLLEVLLAVAIFVGAIVVLSRLVLIGLEFSETSEEQAQAWLIAETCWAELESGARTLGESGPFEVPNLPNWQYSLEAESTDLANLYRVTIYVTKLSPVPGQEFRVQLSRLFFDEGNPAEDES